MASHMKKAKASLKPARELAKNYEHGTRMKYMGGCRCLPCRGANSQYETDRMKEVRESGRRTGVVCAREARDHLAWLSYNGVGLRSVHEASGVSLTVLREISMGRKTRIFGKTEHRILEVDLGAMAAGAIVSSYSTWKLIDRLLEEGFTKTYLARRLGSTSKTPALQIGKEKVLESTRVAVERLYYQLMANGRKEN